MIEKDFINSILQQFERSPNQINRPHCSDSEIVKIGDNMLAVTMDEFSNEDCFGKMNPEDLGWNMAVATISDLFAVGANPAFFIHSICSNESSTIIEQFSRGISRVLKETGSFLIGGDVGSSDSLRYCATAIGTFNSTNYLTRQFELSEQDLWITGTVGDANLSAFTGQPAPLFELRLKEAEFIKSNATACMDTSGGFMDTVWTLHELNNGMEIRLDSSLFPVDRKVKQFCRENGIPEQAFLYGGAGEYELIFTVPKGANVAIPATKIGSVKAGSGLFIDDTEIKNAPPCPRSFSNRALYTKEILKRVMP